MSSFKIVLLLQLFAVAYAAKGNCTILAIGAAQQVFNVKLGIPSTVTWQTPSALGSAIYNIYVTGVNSSDPSTSNGLVAVCNAYNNFLGKLSQQNVDFNDCLNPTFIIKNDLDPLIGYAYAGIMNMVAYHCGGGLFPAMASWDCIRNTYAQRNTALLGCISALHLDSESNITAACGYTKTAITCWQQQFLQVCGNNNEINYYACQTMRSYTSAAYGECNDRCLIMDRPNFAVEKEIEKLQKIDKDMKDVPTPQKALLEEIKAKFMRS
jgi:hypothetical protein